MKKYGISILSFLIGCLLFSSCDDEQEVNSGSGKAATISLSFEAPAAAEIVTKGVNQFPHIEGLCLFIFDSQGDIEGEPIIYGELKGSDGRGQIASDIPTTTGRHYIYAVANTTSDLVTIADLYGIRTKDDLLRLKATLAGELELSSTTIPMIGSVDGATDGLINITDKGSYTIQLKRILASVKFNVSCISNASFVLKSYEVVNYPVTSTLLSDNTDSNTNNKWNGGTVVGTNDQGYSFEFYMFENIKNNADVGSYEERERKKDPTAVDNIEFANAPVGATYIILKGTYSGPANVDKESEKVSAEVSYYVHLGNTNGDNWGNFETRRNIEYIYNIKINGVNDLVTEVEEDDPYDRGDGKISLVASTFNLDCHFETFNITVPKGDEYVTEGDENFGGWLSFRIYDRNSSYRTEALIPNEVANWVSVMMYKKEGDNAYNNDELITSVTTLNEKLNAYFSENPTATEVVLTCFANENPGQGYRECLVFRDKRTGNGSSILRNGFKIRQNYVRKFFDDNGSCYGLEVLNETGTVSEYGTSKNTTDMFDGLANMKKEVSGKDWNVEDMRKAYAACMSRNRDENGNGRIDDDEIKWYLPAINQYIGMWMGANALEEARLYTFNYKVDGWHYISNSYDDSKNNDRKDHWIMWGEEGSSTGMKKSGQAVNQLRCIRNIGNFSGGDYYSFDEANLTFTMNLVGDGVYRNKVFGLELGRSGGHIETPNKVSPKFQVAKETVGGDLSFNNQARQADIGKSACSTYAEELKDGYDKGIYQNSNGGPKKSGYFKKVNKGQGNYYKWRDGNFYAWHNFPSGKDYMYNLVEASEAVSDYKQWRIPNQRELALMHAEKLTGSGKFLMSRTYSAFDTDRGFGYHGENGNLFMEGSINMNNNKKYYIRCVRDK